ncbi:MAG: hypothetical protein Q7V05_11175 [Methanoregula sp.]|nr:hypothetical protein [Methanoregula sp.]
MADFVQNSETKSAIRELADPIADVATFNSIVQSVITGNPFACVSYMTAGVTHDPVEKTKEGYAVKIIYQDSDAKVVGNLSDKFDLIAGFNAGASAILANTAHSTAHGCTAMRRPGQPPGFIIGGWGLLQEFPGRTRHKNFDYGCPYRAKSKPRPLTLVRVRPRPEKLSRLSLKICNRILIEKIRADLARKISIDPLDPA